MSPHVVQEWFRCTCGRRLATAAFERSAYCEPCYEQGYWHTIAECPHCGEVWGGCKVSA